MKPETPIEINKMFDSLKVDVVVSSENAQEIFNSFLDRVEAIKQNTGFFPKVLIATSDDFAMLLKAARSIAVASKQGAPDEVMEKDPASLNINGTWIEKEASCNHPECN